MTVQLVTGMSQALPARAKECSKYAAELEQQLTNANQRGLVYDLAEASEDARAVVVVLQELAREMPEITPALWVTLAHVAVVHGEQEHSLLFAPELPLQAEFADACLHSALLTTSLWWYINARVSKETGFIFNHLCGCGCHITRGAVQVAVPQMNKVVEAFYRHLVGQYHLLQEGFPFRLT